MLSKSFFLALAALGVSTPLAPIASAGVVPVDDVTANTSLSVNVCGTPDPTPEYLEMVEKRLAAYQKNATLASDNAAAKEIEVDLYLHVVASSSALEDGWVTDEMIENQAAALVDAFAYYSLQANRLIQFNPKAIDWTINADWSTSPVDHLDMKRALRKGGYGALNVYLVKSISPGVDGYTPLPVPEDMAQSNNQNNTLFWIDGCVVVTASMPNGGSQPDDPQGKILVHEVGHWFGLLHTFQGGCNVELGGDLVDDTPYHLEPDLIGAIACNATRDTCPSLPGNDPVHNYMNYGVDSCKTEFTPGQMYRMFALWDIFRAGLTDDHPMIQPPVSL